MLRKVMREIKYEWKLLEWPRLQIIHLEAFQKLLFWFKGIFTSLLDLRKIDMREN